jgi:[NiFe] hydrogenase assembly HybE family chaperone
VISLATRLQALEAAFRHIAATRMDGVPVLNPRLDVQAVGFEISEDGSHALGVLVTPWFMNLLRLPLHDDLPPLAVRAVAARDIGTRRLDFIGAFEPGVGAFEACSLFSPMFEFTDQAAAVATAQEALKELRAASRAPAQPARRGFLLGRSGAAA